MPMNWINRSVLRALVVWVTLSLLAACTTLRPVSAGPPDLQRGPAASRPLEAGDRVVVFTRDGRRHEFDVTSVSTELVAGGRESIPTDQIVSIQRRESSAAKTLVLVGTTIIGVTILAVALAAASHPDVHPFGP